jgi:hypothetical protein
MKRLCRLSTGVLPRVAAGLLALLPFATVSTADAPEKRESVALLASKTGMALAREEAEKPWTALKQDKDVFSKDLLIGLPGARIISPNKAVRLDFLSDLSNSSPYPIIETAVRLHASKDVDLDLTLERGRIELTNTRAKGAAKARVHFRTRVWDLTLEKPGTSLTMEIYGRYPAGTRFRVNPKAKEEPLTSVLMVVLSGSVYRKCSVCQAAMSAPPGPALFSWDSITGDDGPKKIGTLPPWAEKKSETPVTMKKREVLEKFRKTIAEHSLGDALADLLHSEDPNQRRLGVYALGAFDQLPSLAKVLTESTHPDTWNNAVVALRHWLGREPGQDQVLYTKLVQKRDLSPVQARAILQMLMGFTKEQQAQPELYTLLIGLLKNEKLALRGLAYWHLQRLAPSVKISFNPAGPKEAWEKAFEAYKKAIPGGKLPPAAQG